MTEMKRSTLTLATTFAAAVLMFASAASAQRAFGRPGFNSAFYGVGVGYGGFGNYGYHSSTAAEGYLRGRASVIDAAGQYNLNTSQAAINYEQAYRASLENSVTNAETFFAKRRINESYRESKQGPAPSQETLADRARQGVPGRLNPEQYEPTFGTLYWPAAFDDARFSATRTQLDRLMADRDAQGGVGSHHYRDVVETTDALKEELRGMIDELSPTEYVQAKKFLNSVAYEARFAPAAEGLASN
jgi:hypothetical protein